MQSVPEALQVLERKQLLTPLQSGRILKGETEGWYWGVISCCIATPPAVLLGCSAQQRSMTTASWR